MTSLSDDYAAYIGTQKNSVYADEEPLDNHHCQYGEFESNGEYKYRICIHCGDVDIEPEDNYDGECFHECPNCNSRCNCSDHPCSCCQDIEVEQEETEL